MSIAAQLLDRLERHYIKPARPGGVFVREVGTNDWGATGRRCDAVYVGFTSASGRLLIGHEVKASRSDWLRELDDPHKSAFWQDNTHAWYVVAPSTAIVKPEELPPTWGLLVPSPRSKVRFDVVVRAPTRDLLTFDPGWLAVRSVIARWDTLHAQQVQQLVAGRVAEEVQRVRERYESQLRAALGASQPTAKLGELQRLTALLDKVNAVLQRAGQFMWPTDEQIITAITDQASAQAVADRARTEAGWRLHELRSITRDLNPELSRLADLYEQEHPPPAAERGEVG